MWYTFPLLLLARNRRCPLRNCRRCAEKNVKLIKYVLSGFLASFLVKVLERKLSQLPKSLFFSVVYTPPRVPTFRCQGYDDGVSSSVYLNGNSYYWQFLVDIYIYISIEAAAYIAHGACCRPA